MDSVPHLANITLALAAALVGGLAARRLRLPTIVGYLVAGVAIGPLTPGLHDDVEAVRELAELGIIFLMFGVGLHFALDDLWTARSFVISAAVLQMAGTAAMGFCMAIRWSWAPSSALVLGAAISVASTVVLVRALTDIGALDTVHGRVAVAWLVLEDVATVAILVFLPAVVSSDWVAGGFMAVLSIVSALAFLAVMLFIGKRIIPEILDTVAAAGSRELFVLVALTLAVGTALASSNAFGISLALGAFVAGVVVRESPFSHQIGADLLPFREAFAVLFFVSMGMLVRPEYLIDNWRQVLALTTLIVVGKALLATLIGFAFPYPARTALIVAAGLSQIGEFSFVVAQAGVRLRLLEDTQYSLILAGAILSITLNPWMFRLVDPIERLLKSTPRIWQIVNHHGRQATQPVTTLTDHVVVVGCGRVGGHIADALGQVGVPRLVIDADVNRTRQIRRQHVPVLFGDAANSEILSHAALERARALVATVPDETASLSIVTVARRLARSLHVIARASTLDGVQRLKNAGAVDVVWPELEGGVEIVRRTLVRLRFPAADVQRYLDAVRKEGFDVMTVQDDRARVLEHLAQAVGDLEIRWAVVADTSPVAGRTLADSKVRTTTGASIVAIGRGQTVIGNPAPAEHLNPGDRVALVGSPTDIAEAERLLTGSAHVTQPARA
jgi:CPA2 family monovalent cation:H+ antiporter-2